MLTSIDDVAQLIATDERFSRWDVRSRKEGYLELSSGRQILVLVWPEVWVDEARRVPHLIRARSGDYSLVLLGSDEQFIDSRIDRLLGRSPYVIATPIPVPAERLLLTLKSQASGAKLRAQAASLELEVDRAHHENELLISIGRALSQQRDLRSLLSLILRRAREVTGADAGSVYVVEGDDEDLSKRRLRFKVSQNDSKAIESKGFTLPVSSSSIVGTCVLSSEVINIPDLYRLDKPGTGNNPWGFVHDRSFDQAHQYQTRSMLTVPMISARDQVIGVIQLINKRARGFHQLEHDRDFDQGVVRFDDVSINYAATLASQAGIALENAMLYDEVQTLFEGFVRASVTAIESRDPTTSGHSERVADLTVGLARAVERVDTGPYGFLSFSVDELKQIEYAGLLHDFGKVGVREHVLVKAKKLYAHQRELILQRFQFIRRSMEVEKLQGKVSYLLEASREEAAAKLSALDARYGARIEELDDYLQFIMGANEPSLLAEGGFERIADIAAHRFVDLSGAEQAYLTEDEVVCLQVLKGTLTSDERREIESHVSHTYKFLKQIPWGRTYGSIPEIAGAHHEKLTGKGYPNQLAASEIPVPAKMMAISDIFDALTASDRPYKRAVPTDRALDILGYEVKDGNLDKDLYQLFIDAKVYQMVMKSKNE